MALGPGFELHTVYVSIMQLDLYEEGLVLTAMLDGGNVVTYVFRAFQPAWWIVNQGNTHTVIQVIGNNERIGTQRGNNHQDDGRRES